MGAGTAAAVMLKVEETLPPPVVTVTVPEPVAAVADTLTGRLMEVAETVAGPPVTPALLKLTVAPVRLVPAMVTV
jgi:hypothetical protein